MNLVEKQCYPVLTEAGDLHYVYTREARAVYEPAPSRKRGKPKEQWWNDGDNEARARVNGPTPLTEKQRHTLDGMARNNREAALRGAQAAGAIRRAATERLIREGMVALGEAATRYGRRTIASTEPETHAGKWTFRWRCDCGATGRVLCTDWIKRGANLGKQCVSCARKGVGSGSSLGPTRV